MTNQEWIQLFFSRSYENQINDLILEDVDYEVPIESLMNYVQNLLDIPYSEFLNNLPTDDYFSLSSRYLPEFDDIVLCTDKLIEYLQEIDNRGISDVEYPVISYNNFGEAVYGKNGSKYLKTAEILGLAYKYYNTWYLNILGYAYPLLNDDDQKSLLARTLLRSRFYRRLVPECINQKTYLHDWLPNYSKQYIKRYLNSINVLLKYCQSEAAICGVDIFLIDDVRIKDSLTGPIEKCSLDIYRKEMRKHRFLTFEECVELAQRVRKGDNEALSKLVNCHLRYAYRQATYYTGRGLTIEDLVQEANIGLITAAEKYDETRGYMFASYAQQWIALEIYKAIADYSSIVRIPLNKLQVYRKIKKFEESYYNMNEFPPSVQQCYEGTGLLEKDVNEFISYPSATSEFFIQHDFDSSFVDEKYEADFFSNKEYASYITGLYLNFLNKKQRAILEMLFGIGYPCEYTLEAIGYHFGLTRERVRQIAEKSLRIIKSRLGIIKKCDKRYIEQELEDDTNNYDVDKAIKRAIIKNKEKNYNSSRLAESETQEQKKSVRPNSRRKHIEFAHRKEEPLFIRLRKENADNQFEKRLTAKIEAYKIEKRKKQEEEKYQRRQERTAIRHLSERRSNIQMENNTTNGLLKENNRLQTEIRPSRTIGMSKKFGKGVKYMIVASPEGYYLRKGKNFYFICELAVNSPTKCSIWYKDKCITASGVPIVHSVQNQVIDIGYLNILGQTVYFTDSRTKKMRRII